MRRRALIVAALATSSGPSHAQDGPARLGSSERRGSGPTISDAARCVVPDPPSPRGGRQLTVRDFGAVGDGRRDDTAALQRAFAALQPLDTLSFGPGRFVHASRLVVAAPRVHLAADGASLHATNPADQALLIQADGVVVRGFTLTAVTDRRRDAPWESRIAIWRDGPRAAAPVRDVHILDNRIVELGEPGTALANSSSSAAIFVHHAQRFTVARNLVRRSLADAIHVTGGSSQGRVVGNTVRESGDDMVAVVSYLPSTLERSRRVATLVRDVLIAHNDLAGQYWGRGISVVGGHAVTIRGNRIDAATHAAGVYIAREAAFRTHGVRGVRVSGNTITRVQTVGPEYSVLEPARAGVRTGHGAIEVVALVADDERPGTSVAPGRLTFPSGGSERSGRGSIDTGRALGVDRVLIEDNVVHDIGTDGIRIGDGWGRRGSIEQPGHAGAAQTVSVTAAPVRNVTIRGNRLGAIRHAALVVFNAGDSARGLVCEGNTLDGRPLTNAACATASTASPAAPPGSSLRCGLR